MFSLPALVIALTLAADPQPAALPTPAQVRAAVERSLPYLDRTGQTWIEEKKCVSCHQVAFMLWSQNEARRQNFAVDVARLAERTEWALDFSLTSPEGKFKGSGPPGLDTLAQMLLSRDPSADKTARPALDKVAARIVEQQKPEGFWVAAGQLPGQKRSKDETNQVSTMWAVLALASLDQPGEAVEKSQSTALEWVKKAQPGESTEWLVTRLLVARQQSEDDLAERLETDLLARQNADGGWPWLKGKASDPLATGQALYAKGRAGKLVTEQSIRKGWKFLLDSQGGDGTWQQPSTLAAKKDKPYPIANFWGTAWAVIGLARTLPE